MDAYNNNGWQGPDPWGDTPQLQDYNSSYNNGWQDSGWQDGPQGPQGPQGPRKPRQRGAGKLIALCLVCALAGGCVYPAYQAVRHAGGTTLYVGERTATQLNTKSVNTEQEMTPAEIYAAYVDSTVGITVDIVGTNIFGQQVKTAAAGSGFVITEDGYILTNYHVVEEANDITVTFVDGKSYPAQLVGGEKSNDIAVIKIDAQGLKPVVIGSSSDMKVGEQVLTIGNPLGELTFTETAGIISAMDRTITMSDGRQINMIQTDCAINSGNSGGPLFNLHGEVIGIVSAKYSGSGYSDSASVEGLGFAIPVDDVADMVSSLVTEGYVTGKPFLGVGLNDVDASAQTYGVPAGAVITVAAPELSGAQAGLKEGDIITQLNDTEVDSANALIAAVKEHEVGETVTFHVFRSGEKLEVKVKLEESTPARQELYNQAVEAKQEELAQQQQEQQSQQNQGSSGYGWPFWY